VNVDHARSCDKLVQSFMAYVYPCWRLEWSLTQSTGQQRSKWVAKSRLRRLYNLLYFVLRIRLSCWCSTSLLHNRETNTDNKHDTYLLVRRSENEQAYMQWVKRTVPLCSLITLTKCCADFQISLTIVFCEKFAIKHMSHFPPHLRYVTAPPRKTSTLEFNHFQLQFLQTLHLKIERFMYLV